MKKSKSETDRSDLPSFAAFLVACLEHRDSLDPIWNERVGAEFSRAVRLADESREEGIDLDAADVAGLGVYGVFAALAPRGPVTRADALAARLCSVALSLLVEPDRLSQAGFAPLDATGPRERLAATEQHFVAWLTAASASIVNLDRPATARDGIIRGYLRLRLGETPDAARHAAQTRAVSRRLRAKDYPHLDAEEIDGALIERLAKPKANPDGLVHLGADGLKLDERRARDLLAAARLRSSGDVSLDADEKHVEPEGRERDPAEIAEAAEMARIVAEIRGDGSDPVTAAALAHLETDEPLASAARRFGVGRKAARLAVDRLKAEGRRRLGRATG
jgi:hypothetical protein